MQGLRLRGEGGSGLGGLGLLRLEGFGNLGLCRLGLYNCLHAHAAISLLSVLRRDALRKSVWSCHPRRTTRILWMNPDTPSRILGADARKQHHKEPEI